MISPVSSLSRRCSRSGPFRVIAVQDPRSVVGRHQNFPSRIERSRRSDRLELLERLPAARGSNRSTCRRSTRTRCVRCRGSRSTDTAARAATEELNQLLLRRPGGAMPYASSFARARADPIGRPGRRIRRPDRDRSDAAARERREDVVLDHLHRRTSGVRRRHGHRHRSVGSTPRRARSPARRRSAPAPRDPSRCRGSRGSPRATARCDALTTSLPDASARRSASRRACARGARCAFPCAAAARAVYDARAASSASRARRRRSPASLHAALERRQIGADPLRRESRGRRRPPTNSSPV